MKEEWEKKGEEIKKWRERKMNLIIDDEKKMFRGDLRKVIQGKYENVEIIEEGDLDKVRKMVGEKEDKDIMIMEIKMKGGKGI